jgi:hypothetical protein
MRAAAGPLDFAFEMRTPGSAASGWIAAKA